MPETPTQFIAAGFSEADFTAITAEDVGQMARAMTAVVTLWPSWVHRRLETITYADQSRIHHKVVLEITVPLSLGGMDALRLLPVPVGLFNKQVLTAFEARDEHGRTISHPTLQENRRLTTRLLWEMMGSVGGGAPADIDPEARKLAWTVTGPLGAAPEAAARLLETWLPTHGGSFDGAQSAERRALTSLFRDLAANYYLSVLLNPADGADRMVELSYDEYGTRVRDRLWRDTAAGFQKDLLRVRTGLADSTHIEVEAPLGCYFVSREASADAAVRFESALGDEAQQRLVSGAIVEALGPTLSVSIHARDATSQALVPHRLFLAPGSLLGPALLMSVATLTGLLAGFAARLLHFHTETSTASVLAAIPAVYVAVVLRPSEHRITRALEAGARTAMVGSAILSLGAAATFVLTFPVTNHASDIPVVGSLVFQAHMGWRAIWWGLLTLLSALNLAFATVAYRRHHIPRDATNRSRRVSS